MATPGRPSKSPTASSKSRSRAWPARSVRSRSRGGSPSERRSCPRRRQGKTRQCPVRLIRTNSEPLIFVITRRIPQTMSGHWQGMQRGHGENQWLPQGATCLATRQAGHAEMMRIYRTGHQGLLTLFARPLWRRKQRQSRREERSLVSANERRAAPGGVVCATTRRAGRHTPPGGGVDRSCSSGVQRFLRAAGQRVPPGRGHANSINRPS